eukprot:771269-Pelagomonas_calceolata.AAC.1
MFGMEGATTFKWCNRIRNGGCCFVRKVQSLVKCRMRLGCRMRSPLGCRRQSHLEHNEARSNMQGVVTAIRCRANHPAQTQRHGA